MSMSKDEKKRKFIDLTVTEEPLSKRQKHNDDLHSSDEENSEIYVAHVVNELPHSISFGTNEVISNTSPASPVAIQLDAEETLEQLKQRAIKINNEKLKIIEIQKQIILRLRQMDDSELKKSNIVLLNNMKSVMNGLILDSIILQQKIEGIQNKNERTLLPFAPQSRTAIIPSPMITAQHNTDKINERTLLSFAPQSRTAIIPPPMITAQHNTDKINDASEEVNFNREQYMELYEHFYQLFTRRPDYSGMDVTLKTYVEPSAAQLKLYYITGEMVPNGATIQKVKRLTYCNGEPVITGRNLVSGKMYFYLETNPLKPDQLWATDLIPPHAVPVKTPGAAYSTYNGKQVIQLCLTAVKEKAGFVLRKKGPDYSAHYEFHTKAINTINNTTIVFFTRSSSSQQILFPLVTNSLNEVKSNQSSLSTTGIQNTFPITSDFAMFTAANNVPQSQKRKNESHTGTLSSPQITINQIIMEQENETPQLPGFKHLLSSLSIFNSDNKSSSSLPVDDNEKTQTNLDF